MTLGSRSLISHHGWMLSQITYIGSTAELARKHLMWGTCESLLSKATWKTTHASISGSAGSSTQAIRSFFVNPQGVSSWSSETSGSTLPSTSHTSLDTTVVTGDVIRAEVLWTLKVVMCHYSFNSCNDISATFRAMFPDSGIVKTFTLWSISAHIWHALDLLYISMSSWWIWYEVQHGIRWVYEQDITKRANGLHHQILGRQYQQGGCMIPWV